MQRDRVCAEQVMTSPALTVSAHASLRDALRLLVEEGCSGVPVVEGDGQTVGVVSFVDLVGFIAHLERPLRADDAVDYDYPAGEGGPDDGVAWERAVGRIDDDLLANTRVSEVMSGDVIAVSPRATLDEVAATLADRRIHRVIVAEDRHPLGVISALDLVRIGVEASARAR